ncbi:MAG: hypothetical protein EAZ89_11015 [Bacteroidetes bacterium]|jgi:hypothetical protein|nr:MAG: hypothetical protein EAZ89_11015 [Bacteroidota bacterium]
MSREENATLFLKHPIVPWAITALMAMYVYVLTFHAKNRQPLGPSYDFYDTTVVTLRVRGDIAPPEVYGRFNNILEGDRQLIKGRMVEEDVYRITFQVNSPRPAVLYVQDEAMEVFLTPGDTSLTVNVSAHEAPFGIDSVIFRGKNANICRYYQLKTQRFRQVHIRSARNATNSEDFPRFAARLDSMAARELAFLAEQEIFNTLPDWFADFEKSDILYQKGYLKLSAAVNREVPDDLLDHLAPQNPGAVFSYYYYLYLREYITRLAPVADTSRRTLMHKHLAVAETLLDGEPHDVFFTWYIYDAIEAGQIELAEELIRQYEEQFESNRYVRFLRTRIGEKKEEIKGIGG